MVMVLIRDKRAVSIMIGYILLVVFALVISVGVYQWLKTFVPAESLECPDGVSVFLRSAEYDSDTAKLTIEIVNSGRFNIGGYFISMADTSGGAPNVDISGDLNEGESSGADKQAGFVYFIPITGEKNQFKPGDSGTHVFDLTNQPYVVRVIPTREQTADGRDIFVGCAEARTEQKVSPS